MLRRHHTLFLILALSFVVACEQDEAEDPGAPLVDCVRAYLHQAAALHDAAVSGGGAD